MSFPSKSIREAPCMGHLEKLQQQQYLRYSSSSSVGAQQSIEMLVQIWDHV